MSFTRITLGLFGVLLVSEVIIGVAAGSAAPETPVRAVLELAFLFGLWLDLVAFMVFMIAWVASGTAAAERAVSAGHILTVVTGSVPATEKKGAPRPPASAARLAS